MGTLDNQSTFGNNAQSRSTRVEYDLLLAGTAQGTGSVTSDTFKAPLRQSSVLNCNVTSVSVAGSVGDAPALDVIIQGYNGTTLVTVVTLPQIEDAGSYYIGCETSDYEYFQIKATVSGDNTPLFDFEAWISG